MTKNSRTFLIHMLFTAVAIAAALLFYPALTWVGEAPLDTRVTLMQFAHVMILATSCCWTWSARHRQFLAFVLGGLLAQTLMLPFGGIFAVPFAFTIALIISAGAAIAFGRPVPRREVRP